MSKVIMTAKQLVDRLKYLESQPSYYKAKYPYNLCLVNPPKSTKSFMTFNGIACTNYNPHNAIAVSADCVNLYKALLNGYDVNNHTVGYYQADCSNVKYGGNCTEWQLISQCSDVSQDFSKLKNSEPRLLYMSGHIGGYVGDFQKYGKTYNVVECTSSWGGGILFSYVDSQGRRFKSKGGEQRKAWTHHGLMTPWVDYSEHYDTFDGDMQPLQPSIPEPTPTKPVKPSDQDRHEGSTVAHYIDKKYSRSYKVNTNSGLNLRQGVGTSTRSLGVLPYGTMVRCFGYYDYDKDGNLWLYVGSPFDVGFVSANYLE